MFARVLAKKLLTVIPRSHSALFAHKPSQTPKKDIHIGRVFNIKDKNNVVSTALFAVESDKSNTEDPATYFKRSFEQLSNIIHRNINSNNDHYICFKVIQCLINPDSDITRWGPAQQIHIYNTEHAVSVFLKRNKNGNISILDGSLVSKIHDTTNPSLSKFETPEDMTSSFFSNKQMRTGAKEFFLIIDTRKLKINLDDCLTYILEMITTDKEYCKRENACGQAILKALGLKVKSKISPQTAVRTAVMDSLVDDDIILKTKLMEAFDESQLFKTALELGHEEKTNLLRNRRRP